MSRPSMRIRPRSGRSKPASILSKVVLPQPDGPKSAKNSRGAKFERDPVDRVGRGTGVALRHAIDDEIRRHDLTPPS